MYTAYSYYVQIQDTFFKYKNDSLAFDEGKIRTLYSNNYPDSMIYNMRENEIVVATIFLTTL